MGRVGLVIWLALCLRVTDENLPQDDEGWRLFCNSSSLKYTGFRLSQKKEVCSSHVLKS